VAEHAPPDKQLPFFGDGHGLQVAARDLHHATVGERVHTRWRRDVVLAAVSQAAMVRPAPGENLSIPGQQSAMQRAQADHGNIQAFGARKRIRKQRGTIWRSFASVEAQPLARSAGHAE
jgi:hypothetical protein